MIPAGSTAKYRGKMVDIVRGQIDSEMGLRAPTPRSSSQTSVAKSCHQSKSVASKDPARKKKRLSAKEKQAEKPKLDRNVPVDQRLSDKALVEMAKKLKAYDRHSAARCLSLHLHGLSRVD